jgi:hypothetical protein
MAAYNFQLRFVERILNGTKRHTIRATRKRRTKVGETLYLFTGMRTKKCKRLLEVVCTKVGDIDIFLCPLVFGGYGAGVVIDGEALDESERERLAWADGFASFKAMLDFWEGKLPFHGEIIHWNTREALEFQRLVPSARNVRFVDPGRKLQNAKSRKAARGGTR